MEPLSQPVTRRGFGFYFWVTIAMLFVATIALVVLAMFRPVPDDPPPAPISLTQEGLDQLGEKARQAGREAVGGHIDDGLDRMFDPVHASVPAYADFHYSVWGQYAELLTAAAETTGLVEEVGSLMRKHLFDGFEARQAEQMTQLDDVWRKAVSDLIADEGRRIAGGTGQPLPDAVQAALNDAKARMIATGPVHAAGSMAASAVLLAVIKPIASKIVASTAAKAAGKGLLKATGIGGTAAAGAAVGSFVGPAGTIIGGIGGAVAGWLLVDLAAVSLDEYFNRDEFEAELHKAIDEQKERMREDILHHYAQPAG